MPVCRTSGIPEGSGAVLRMPYLFSWLSRRHDVCVCVCLGVYFYIYVCAWGVKMTKNVLAFSSVCIYSREGDMKS